MTNIFRKRIWLAIVFLCLSTTAVADKLDDTRRAAEQGEAWAQIVLGARYFRGKGAPQDDWEAVKWFRLAAEQGDSMAQHLLASTYYFSESVRDYKKAVKWFRMAAEQGHAEAQFSLGVMYDNGKGVPKNNQEAHIWYSLAVASGSAEENAIIYRDRAEQRLSHAQQAEAQKEATRRWEEIAKRQVNMTKPEP